MDQCKTLGGGRIEGRQPTRGTRVTSANAKGLNYPLQYGRGLHSSTSRLNLSAFCGIGGTFRGCLEGV